ncbi:hypothetical protein R0J91_22645, partial [Micrococcus sp. SIMBA_131]
SVVADSLNSATEMSVLMEDLFTRLAQTSNGLRRGRYPQRAPAQKMAQVPRRVADDLEARAMPPHDDAPRGDHRSPG